MVYDLIPFFNELDILKLRLNILDSYVDRFVIEESTHTFSGQTKELIFEKNREMFKQFLPKIDYIIVDDSPPELDPHQRDRYQKNHLIRGLKNAGEKDVIILSDLDEIPNPLVLEKIIAGFDPDKVYHLAQRMFHGFLNMEETSGRLLSITGEFAGVTKPKWLGTKVFSLKNIPETGIIYLREADVSSSHSIRIDDGGWHFSYMGGSGEKDVAKRVREKIIAAAHQEYNNSHTLAEISAKAILGKDFLGSAALFARVEIDESFPAYLREHLLEFEHLLLPPVSRTTKRLTKILMLIKRFFRKLILRIIRFLKTGKILRDRPGKERRRSSPG
jgi:beta-1,4-mannosyl-glycoprotein beta-1,4-N-acetylglucosaminyltransferase